MFGSVSTWKALLGHGEASENLPQTLGNPRNEDQAPEREGCEESVWRELGSQEPWDVSISLSVNIQV